MGQTRNAVLAGLVTAVVAGAYVTGAGAQRPPQGVADTDYGARLDELDARDKALSEEQDTVEQQLGIVRRRMLARGRAYYKLVRAGLLPIGGGFDALVDHAARVERLRTSLQRDIHAEAELVRRQDEIARELQRIREQRGPLKVQQEAMQRAASAMKQVDERRAAFLRAFGSGGMGSDHVAIYGADGRRGAPQLSFEASRGRLSFPLGGRAEVRHDLRGLAPGGVDLEATHATVARAIYPGRVVFAGEYASYGRTVVVDHGEQYFSLYARLSRLDVRVGDVVEDRGAVGWVSGLGGQPPRLYFEIRRGREVLESAPWLGL